MGILFRAQAFSTPIVTVVPTPGSRGQGIPEVESSCQRRTETIFQKPFEVLWFSSPGNLLAPPEAYAPTSS
jgi:hypothetical protein